MKKKILELLQNCQDFISGQEISEKFGVSRTAVWKAIRQLEAEGYVIEAVRNKGYRLKEEPDLLTEEQLQKYLETDWAGQHLVVFDETDSTNNQAKRLAEEGAEHGLLVLSDCQTSGKGRRGRSWDSKAGEGIFMTLLLKPDIQPGKCFYADPCDGTCGPGRALKMWLELTHRSNGRTISYVTAKKYVAF